MRSSGSICQACGSVAYDEYPYLKFPNTVKAILWARSLQSAKRILRKRIQRDGYHRSSSIFRGRVVVCNECGHGFFADKPTDAELDAYYSSTYWDQRNSVIPEPADPQKHPRTLSQIAMIERVLGPIQDGRTLEIGAGPALPSRYIKAKLGDDSRVDLIEPGYQWEAYYEKHGIRRVAKSFPTVVSDTYALVLASHWLEHVTDLSQVLSTLRDTLDQKGALFVEVPHCDRQYWKERQSDEPHIHFFTRESLTRALSHAGFCPLEVGTFGVSRRQSRKGVRPSKSDYFEPNPEGQWLRGVFRRI